MVSFYKANRSNAKAKENDHNTVLNVEIDTVNAQGQGLCLSHKPIIAVYDGLPGEVLKVNVTKKRKHIWYAKRASNNITNTHAQRTVPFCKWVEQCGGCSTQHCKPDAMLQFKQDALDGQITRQLNLTSLPWTPPGIDETKAYRRKARLAVDARNKQSIKVGFRSVNSSNVVDIDDCSILTPDLQKIMTLLHNSIHNNTLFQHNVYQALRFVGHITLLQLPEYNNECSVSIHCVKALNSEAMQWWSHFASKVNEAITSPVQVTLWLKEKMHELVSANHVSAELKPNSNDFIQVNAAVNEKMVDLACEAMSDSNYSPILELYSGMGNFTWPLSKLCHHIVAVEGSEVMTEKARRIAQKMGIKHVVHQCRNLNDPQGIEDLLCDKTYKVLLDPSRDGALAVCQQLTQQVASKIVYISCNPQTWLRDAKVLLANGFSLSSLTLMDMFPYTPHTELFSVFSHS